MQLTDPRSVSRSHATSASLPTEVASSRATPRRTPLNLRSVSTSTAPTTPRAPSAVAVGAKLPRAPLFLKGDLLDSRHVQSPRNPARRLTLPRRAGRAVERREPLALLAQRSAQASRQDRSPSSTSTPGPTVGKPPGDNHPLRAARRYRREGSVDLRMSRPSNSCGLRNRTECNCPTGPDSWHS